jgi:hypothetical protein
MKRKLLATYLYVSLWLLFTIIPSAWAASTKLSLLTELATTPAGTDEMYINDGGVSKKIQVDNLMNYPVEVVSDTTPQLGGDLDLNEKVPTEDYYACDDTCVPVSPDPVSLSGKGTHIKFDDAGTDEDIIDGFTNQVSGGIYSFLFVDKYWTIDFSGTNLFGHNGIDWEPTAGDSMECKSIDGTNMYCTVSRPTALDISMYYDMPVDATPDADDRWHGPTEEWLAGEALSQWELVYVTHDTGTPEIKLWDANDGAIQDFKPLGVVIESGGIANASTGTVGVFWGVGRNDGWTFVDNQDEGKTVYGGNTPGELTVTPPSVGGEIVCAVGTLLDEDEIQFNFGLCATVEN